MQRNRTSLDAHYTFVCAVQFGYEKCARQAESFAHVNRYTPPSDTASDLPDAKATPNTGDPPVYANAADEITDGSHFGADSLPMDVKVRAARAAVDTFDTTGPAIYDTLSGERLRTLAFDAQSLPEQLGPWRICNLVGRGGMGEVWRAERCDGMFEMDVAMKFLRSDRPDVLERFKFERRVLAQLDHPNIARLIDGGVTPDGLPYLVTEFVEGEQLDRWCEQKRPKLRERLRLFLQVCDAVAYAHSELVVHRDIKPGNILIDAEDTAHLLDFGIAKVVTGPGLDEATDESPHTPEYAAPEQVQGGAITVRTDVYALGLLLYWLLTGERPQARGGPLAEQIERILERVPALPSAAVLPTMRALVSRSELSGDLDCIVSKAIQKNPADRFSSVSELAGDVRSYLAGRPITARHASNWERISAYLRRNAQLVTAGTIAALLILSAGGVAIYHAGRAGESTAAMLRQQLQANARENETLGARAFISALLKDVELQGAAGPELARRAHRYAVSTLVNFPELQAGVIWEVAGAYANFELYAERESMLRESYELRRGQGPRDAEAAAACALAAQRAEAGHSAQARTLLDAADVLLQPSDETNLWAQLDCARIGGRALRYLGDYERAETQIARAAQMMRVRYGAGEAKPDSQELKLSEVRHSQYVDMLNGLAIAHIQAGHFRAGESTLIELGALLHAQGREQSNQMANVYGNLANAQRALGRYESARNNSDLGLALQRKRDPNALNPSTICLRAYLAQQLGEPNEVVVALVAQCKAMISADLAAPQLSARQCWAELAEIAVLRGDDDELSAAQAALDAFAAKLSAAERARDIPMLRLALVQAQRHYTRTGALPEGLSGLLNLDAQRYSSLMPIKAAAMALAVHAARAGGDSARASQIFSELKQVVGDEYPVSHPIFLDN